MFLEYCLCTSLKYRLWNDNFCRIWHLIFLCNWGVIAMWHQQVFWNSSLPSSYFLNRSKMKPLSSKRGTNHTCAKLVVQCLKSSALRNIGTRLQSIQSWQGACKENPFLGVGKWKFLQPIYFCYCPHSAGHVMLKGQIQLILICSSLTPKIHFQAFPWKSSFLLDLI
jgi:hypothetical protein